MHTSSQHGGRFKTFITTQNYILDSRLENVLQGKMSNSKALLEHQDYFKVFAFSWFFSKKIVLCEISPIYYFCGFLGFTVFRKKAEKFLFSPKKLKKINRSKSPASDEQRRRKESWLESVGRSRRPFIIEPPKQSRRNKFGQKHRDNFAANWLALVAKEFRHSVKLRHFWKIKFISSFSSDQ